MCRAYPCLIVAKAGKIVGYLFTRVAKAYRGIYSFIVHKTRDPMTYRGELVTLTVLVV